MYFYLFLRFVALEKNNFLKGILEDMNKKTNNNFREDNKCLRDKMVASLFVPAHEDKYNDYFFMTKKVLELFQKVKTQGNKKKNECIEEQKQTVEENKTTMPKKEAADSKLILRVFSFSLDIEMLKSKHKECLLNVSDNSSNYSDFLAEKNEQTSNLINCDNVADFLLNILKLSYEDETVITNTDSKFGVEFFINSYELGVNDNIKENYKFLHQPNAFINSKKNPTTKDHKRKITMTMVFVDTCFNLAKYYLIENVKIALNMEKRSFALSFVMDITGLYKTFGTEKKTGVETDKTRSISALEHYTNSISATGNNDIVEQVSKGFNEDFSVCYTKSNLRLDFFETDTTKITNLGPENIAFDFEQIKLSRFLYTKDQKNTFLMKSTEIVNGFIYKKNELIKKKDPIEETAGPSNTESTELTETSKCEVESTEPEKYDQFEFIYRFFGRDEIILSYIENPTNYCKIEHLTYGEVTPKHVAEFKFLLNNRKSTTYPFLVFNILLANSDENKNSHLYTFFGLFVDKTNKEFVAPIKHNAITTSEENLKEKEYLDLISSIVTKLERKIECEATKHTPEGLAAGIQPHKICTKSFVTGKNTNYKAAIADLGYEILSHVYPKDKKLNSEQYKEKLRDGFPIMKYFLPEFKEVENIQILTYNKLYEMRKNVSTNNSAANFIIHGQQIRVNKNQYTILYTLSPELLDKTHKLNVYNLHRIIEMFDDLYNEAFTSNTVLNEQLTVFFKGLFSKILGKQKKPCPDVCKLDSSVNEDSMLSNTKPDLVFDSQKNNDSGTDGTFENLRPIDIKDEIIVPDSEFLNNKAVAEFEDATFEKSKFDDPKFCPVNEVEKYKSDDDKSDNVKSGDIKSGEIKSDNDKSGDGKSGEIKSGEVKSDDVKSYDFKFGDIESEDFIPKFLKFHEKLASLFPSDYNYGVDENSASFYEEINIIRIKKALQFVFSLISKKVIKEELFYYIVTNSDKILQNTENFDNFCNFFDKIFIKFMAGVETNSEFVEDSFIKELLGNHHQVLKTVLESGLNETNLLLHNASNEFKILKTVDIAIYFIKKPVVWNEIEQQNTGSKDNSKNSNEIILKMSESDFVKKIEEAIEKIIN